MIHTHYHSPRVSIKKQTLLTIEDPEAPLLNPITLEHPLRFVLVHTPQQLGTER
jgi:hypothetical protein